MSRVQRLALLHAIAEAGRTSRAHRAHFNTKDGGHVYFPDTQVRLFLRDDMAPLESAIVDAPALEIMLDRIQKEFGAVDLDFRDGENEWTFRAYSRVDGYLCEVARGEGISRAEAVAVAYAESFRPLVPSVPAGAR